MDAKISQRLGSIALWVTAVGGGLCFTSKALADGAPDPFYMGADVSLIPFMEQQGVVFKNLNGVAMPPDEILYDEGANLFRLRIFVNPSTDYTSSEGAIQSEAYDISLAQQLKADDPGAKLMLDFHYSDTWADPTWQATPSAWSGQTLTQMESSIQTYTDNTLTDFKNAGVMPSIVQVGNELDNGMDWPIGQINYSGTTQQQEASWAALGGLLKSAIAGVRQAQGAGPAVQVAIHVSSGDRPYWPQYFFQHLSDPAYGNVDPSTYDIMGVSYYPDIGGAFTSTPLATLQSSLTALIQGYNKKVMVLETVAPWESAGAPESDPAYPDTPAGQEQFLLDLRNMVMNLPDGDGEGLLWWYPEAVQVPGYTVYNDGSTALWDSNGNALPALEAFNVPEPASFALCTLGCALMLARPNRRA